LLRSLEAATVDGVRPERLSVERDGVVWAVVSPGRRSTILTGYSS
jgi:hypothetical protein